MRIFLFILLTNYLMALTDKALDRCQKISGQMLEDSLSFGPRTIIDPDNGMPIEIEGYDVDANQDVLVYLFSVADFFEHYYNCLFELFFFETLLSPEVLPDFQETEHIAHYLQLNYQHWLIKINTIFDCTRQTVNAVFELGIPVRDVNRRSFAKRSLHMVESAMMIHIEQINQLLRGVVQANARRKSPTTIQQMRHKLVHTNEFDHPDLSDLHSDVVSFNLSLFYIDAFDLQASISAVGIAMLQEVQKTNLDVIKEVYPIFEYLGVEYGKRFKGKLLK
jgi:hypothetical protein